MYERTDNPTLILDAKILIVDDEEGNLRVLERLLKKIGYREVLTANSGEKGVELYRREQPDLVLLDLKMPEFSGFDVMKALRQEMTEDYLPILILTAQQDRDTRLEALENGAKDFLTKPFELPEILARINNMLEVRLLHKEVRNQNRILEQRVRERTEELERTRLEVIHRLGRAAEYRDNETGMHVIRMSLYAGCLARAAGLPDEDCHLIQQASPMHDVGKIGIPDRILLKPGKLDGEEWSVMKTHSQIGATILSGSGSKMMALAESIALNHHEQWCGKGYPNGLEGEAIPIEGRIVTVCDVFDALTSERPYKKAWTVEQAMGEIEAKSGILFDPELVVLFKKQLPRMVEISHQYADTGETHLHKLAVGKL